MGNGLRRSGVPAPRDANVRRVMLAQRSRDTAPEMALRRALHGLGFRYRVDLPLPGMGRRRSDVTFVKWRTVVFVQGCFWHACPQHRHAPVHNAEWWREKFEGNVRRDADTDAHLVRMGWVPLRIWEHETVGAAVAKVVEALADRGHPRALCFLKEGVHPVGALCNWLGNDLRHRGKPSTDSSEPPAQTHP